jgi:hypothetical protein
MSSWDGAKSFAGDFRAFLNMPTLEQAVAHQAVARVEVHDTRSCRKARRRAVVGNDELPVLHGLAVNCGDRRAQILDPARTSAGCGRLTIRDSAVPAESRQVDTTPSARPAAAASIPAKISRRRLAGI